MADCLIVIDRDGTLIEKHDYLGKSDDWKLKVSLIEKTVFLLKALDILFPDNLKIVFTNQTGIAIGYFTKQRVDEINKYVKRIIEKKGIIIDHWIYSPEIDIDYAAKKCIPHNKYFKNKSNRKPNPQLLINTLKNLDLSLSSFNKKIVIGDSEDDRLLAENIQADFIKIV